MEDLPASHPLYGSEQSKSGFGICYQFAIKCPVSALRPQCFQGFAGFVSYSLSAVEGKDTVKAVTVGGIACTEETVLDGSYAIQRPFVLVTKTDAPLSTAAQAFFDYATSTAANDLIKAAGAVPVAK